MSTPRLGESFFDYEYLREFEAKIGTARNVVYGTYAVPIYAKTPENPPLCYMLCPFNRDSLRKTNLSQEQYEQGKPEHKQPKQKSQARDDLSRYKMSKANPSKDSMCKGGLTKRKPILNMVAQSRGKVKQIHKKNKNGELAQCASSPFL